MNVEQTESHCQENNCGGPILSSMNCEFKSVKLLYLINCMSMLIIANKSDYSSIS